jgi:voltage-gated sodium channel
MDRSAGASIVVQVEHEAGDLESEVDEDKHLEKRGSISALGQAASQRHLDARRRANDGDVGSFHPTLSLARWISDAAGRRSRFLAQAQNVSLQWRIAQVMESHKLNAFILLVVVVDSIQAMRTVSSRESDSVSVAVMASCLIIYVIEIGLRIFAFGSLFFRDPWDISDFCVVVLCTAGGICETQNVEDAAILTLLPLFRLIRALRTFPQFVHTFPEVRYLLSGYVDSLRSIFWISALVVVEIYLFAVVGVFLYGGREADHDELRDHFFDVTGQEISDFFGTITSAAKTLVKTLTFDDWVSIVEPIGQKRFSAWPYFLLFIFLGAFGLLNLMVGVLNDEMNDRSDQTKQYRRHLLASWQERAFVVAGSLFDLIDQDESESISSDELTICLARFHTKSRSQPTHLTTSSAPTTHHARRPSLNRTMTAKTLEAVEKEELRTPAQKRRTTNVVYKDNLDMKRYEKIELELNGLGLHVEVVMNFVEEHILFLKPEAEITRFEFQNIIASLHDTPATRSDICTSARVCREIREQLVQFAALQTKQNEMVNCQLAEMRDMIKASSSPPWVLQSEVASGKGCI